MPNVVLGVTGSVAAYRAADLARDLMRAGCTVRACLTESASRFVSTDLFEALTGQPCLIDTFDEPIPGRMAHIDWARQADVLVIAPATANTIAQIARGEGTNMLTTLALAFEGPMVVAPAMNPAMYGKEAIEGAIDDLQARGAVLVEPVEGDVACGEHGQGKLASNERIVEATLVLLSRKEMLSGKRLLITSGPTQEPIDAVRYMTNRSSGRMGAALAQAGLLMGAEVSVITGPTHVPLPRLARVMKVRTAAEMLEAALKEAPQANWILGAAAVADYRPESPIEGKRRRTGEPWSLRLIPNPDVLAAMAAAAKPGATLIGFAAEAGSDEESARDKVKRKGLFAIAMNDISRRDVGFETAENELHLLFADGQEQFSGRRSKLACALWLLEAVAAKRSTSDSSG